MKITKISRQRIVDKKVNKLNSGLKDEALGSVLERNLEEFKKLFTDNDTIIYRYFENISKAKFCLIYTDGIVYSPLINDNIIKPIINSAGGQEQELFLDLLISHIIQVNDVKKTDSMDEIVKAVTYGDSILYVDGIPEVLIISTKNFDKRAITEPDSEKILNGPREGFTESLLTNLSMIRRKVRTNQLKFKYRTFGTRTNTQVCICYIDDLINRKILDELYRRLDKINIDGVLDTNYFTELIKDSQTSIFRTTGITERPDVVVGKLLEGRIALFVDGTPVVLTLPYLFSENFQSSEDYYLNYYYTAFSRFLRMLGFVLTITVPAFYISIVAFHQEILPTPLLINIAVERSSVPLPAYLEAIIMLIVFDILRETGIRMPTNMGQALSIVGALVIGQSAVQAKLIAAPMVIVVAFTGITSLLIPKLNAPIISLRFAFLILSTIFGLFGLVMGLSVMVIHLLMLRSFGVPHFTNNGNLKFQEIKDTIIRAPWWMMNNRPKFLSSDRKRMKTKNGGQ